MKKKRKERGKEFNQSEISEVFGIDPRQIRRLMDEGVPHKKTKKGVVMFNSQDFFEWFVQRELSKKYGEIEKHKERYERARADEKELTVQMLRGSVVEMDLLEDAMIPMIHNAKAKLLSLPHAMAHRVATLREVPQIEAALEEKVYEVLGELAYDRKKIVARQISRRSGRSVEAAAEAEG